MRTRLNLRTIGLWSISLISGGHKKEIRKDSSVPVIFLTARKDEVDRIVGLEIGGDDYVSKPFSPRELAARVKAVLRRTSSGEAASANEGTSRFTIDENQLVISYCGKSLDLSRYEYRLLKTLMSHPGWVFSREKLKDLVWEDPEASLSRTVDTHIKTIRAKLKAINSEDDPIKTHRGLGYSFKEGS